jgi:TatD DNase family protein
MTYPFPIYDAHNHPQDSRLQSQMDAIVEGIEAIPLRKAVVNGTRSEDWSLVSDLSLRYKWVVPCIGLHPWFVKERREGWERVFEDLLDTQRFGVGEIGLDRWIHDHDIRAQESVFRGQLERAAQRGLPVSIHCLKAWGALYEVLRTEQRPPSGFLLHSYGGPVEMVNQFLELGAYFSLSGYFAHPRKTAQREAFRQVPLERLLLETDAPDMIPPATHQLHFLCGSEGEELNHPANIPAVYEFAADLYGIAMEELAAKVEGNFQRLFQPLL